MILSAIAAKLNQRSKGDVKGRHYEASLIVQAVTQYLRYAPNASASSFAHNQSSFALTVRT